MSGRCHDCRYFNNDPARMEATLPGVKVLSSGYGSVWADAGLCSLRQELWSPWRGCRSFESRGAEVVAGKK